MTPAPVRTSACPLDQRHVRTFGLGDNGLMWVIAARLNDGQRVYFNAAGERQGQSDWSPRINQAQSFDSEAEAAKVAAAFDTNSAANGYEVLRIAPK